MKVTGWIILKYTLGFMIALLLLTVVGFLLTRFYQQVKMKRATAINLEFGVESLEAVQIGGLKQWIYLRGFDRSNPVLLFLQDGYGIPMIHRAREFCRATGLDRIFTVVFWDKRGEGKSRRESLPAAAFDSEIYRSDVVELTKRLRKRFNMTKIYLMGHSGGSELGLTTVAKHPELFRAFIGVGQVVDLSEAYRRAYAWAMQTAQRQNNSEAVTQLAKIGKPPYSSISEIVTLEKWKLGLGGMVYDKKKADAHLGHLLKMLLFSPEYTLSDIWYVLSDPYWAMKLQGEELFTIKITNSVAKVNIPVYFLQGSHDIGSPIALLEEFVEGLAAPDGKQIVRFEEAGHYLFYEHPEQVGRELEKIKAKTLWN